MRNACQVTDKKVEAGQIEKTEQSVQK